MLKSPKCTNSAKESHNMLKQYLRHHDSCRVAFREVKTLTVAALYILKSMMYSVKADIAMFTRHKNVFSLIPPSLYEEKSS